MITPPLIEVYLKISAEDADMRINVKLRGQKTY